MANKVLEDNVTQSNVVQDVVTINSLPQSVPASSTGSIKHILVAGINYHTGNSFIKHLNNYKEKIAGKDDIFIIIDLGKGTIKTTQKGTKENVEKFEPITKKNYPSGHHFDNLGKTDYITKFIIYKLIEDIGVNDPKTLQQVCIFSHAHYKGPILANSNETDAVDIDMRINDISPSNFDFTNFKNAFTTDGKFKIFGCQSHPPFNYLLKAIMKNSKYKANGSTSETDEFIINDLALPDNYGGYYDKVSTFIDPSLYTDIGNGKIKFTFKQIKKLFAISYCTNYASLLAKKVDVIAQYSLPATYASFGSPDEFRISADTKSNVPFYKTYLHVEIGELNYGIYDQKTVLRLESL